MSIVWTRVASRVRGVEGGLGTPWKGRKMEGRRLRVGVAGAAGCRVLGGGSRGGGLGGHTDVVVSAGCTDGGGEGRNRFGSSAR